MSTSPDRWRKDPSAVLDYAFDWSAWLGDGETISSHAVTVGEGLTKDSDSKAGDVITVWLSGGTVGNHNVTCRITTSQGRTDERTRRVTVAER